MDDKTLFRIGVLRGMIADAKSKGLTPNGVIMGENVISRINADVTQLTGLVFNSKYPENQTIFGLPIIQYYKDPEALRLTFEEFSVI